MADAFGLSDVSTPDTGKGSELKTGGRRKYNMPGHLCDKYTGEEKQDCLHYRGRFAKLAKTQEPSSSVKEEKSVTGKDTSAAYSRQFKRKGGKY